MTSSTDHMSADDANSTDGEGVWSPEIEDAFQEALGIYLPCGRRKHILQEEGGGKMYGRNELIARHIMLKTGKTRTRKQVSSHIQVLARRKAKGEVVGSSNGSNSSGLSPSPSGISSISNHAINQHHQNNINHNNVISSINGNNHHHHHHNHLHHSTNQNNHHPHLHDHLHHQQQQHALIGRPQSQPMAIHHQNQHLNNNNINGNNNNDLHRPMKIEMATSHHNHNHHNHHHQTTTTTTTTINGVGGVGVHQPSAIVEQQLLQARQAAAAAALSGPYYDIWIDRAIATQKIRLVEFSAFIEYRNFHNNNNNNNNNQTTQSSALTVNGLNGSSQLQNQSLAVATVNGHHNQQQQQTTTTQLSAGFTRHTYVKIDYRLGSGCGGSGTGGLQTNLLEKIGISQIQDKFPGISEPNGLFQRGPSDAFFLIKFWADLNNDYIEDQNSYFGFSSHFETIEPYRDINCSTKACSYGIQVVEKVGKVYGAFNSLNGRYSYEIRSDMCEFIKQFIRKLRKLPLLAQMNSVLENFTVLQVITKESPIPGNEPEILLCLAYVFEIAPLSSIDDSGIQQPTLMGSNGQRHSNNNNQSSSGGPQYNVYKLIRD